MQMDNIFTRSLNTGVNLGLKTSNEINTSIIEQVKKDHQIIANQQAKEINEKFKQVKGRLSVISDFLDQSFKKNNLSRNNLHIPLRIKGNSPEDEPLLSDTAFIKYNLAPDVKINESIMRDLQGILDIELLFHTLTRNNNLFDNIYVALENGILFSFSKYKSIPTFDPRKQEWYKKGIKANGEPVWIDTYIDARGVIVTACVKTFHYPNGQIAGVIAINVKYSDLIEQLLNNDLNNGSFNFLLDKNGTYIGENSILNANETWYKALHDMSVNKYQDKIVSIDSKDYYLFFSKIKDTNWSLGLMLPAKIVSLTIEEIKIKIATQIEEAKQNDRTIFFETLQNFLIIFIVTAILSASIATMLSASITKPLKKLIRQVNNLGKINSQKIELEGKDELAELSRIFNKMSSNLTNYIKELEYANAQTEHINSELEIAQRIQNGLLPNLNADFFDKKTVDFFAIMIPAKEIGGDFYDIFYMDSSKQKICFLVADVSGKGIPAAIYMAQAKVLIKTSVLQTKNLALAMKYVNSILSENNEACMFITVFAISIDLITKECVMVNCGHNNPLISIKGEPYNFLKMKNSMAIGIDEISEYEEHQIQLRTNDKIYLYTDGTVEAMNNRAEFFGNDRLVECANKHLNADPKELDHAIRTDITLFTANMLQSDDITTLAIQIL
jgi:sigma-B regulation protein RsbU (phosphoserine phosphatase)